MGRAPGKLQLLVLGVASVALLSSCKEALGIAAAAAVDIAVAAAAEGIAQAMKSDPDQVADPTMPDDTSTRRLTVHPLANLVATHDDGVISARTLATSMRSADVVWITLRYDNPDQFRVAGNLADSVYAFGGRPSLVFAAVPTDDQVRLSKRDPWLTPEASARALSDSVPWASYGIETPAMLEHLVASAYGQKVPLTAGAYPAAKLSVFEQGPAAAHMAEGKALGLDQPWSTKRTEALQNALAWQNCAELPAAAIDSALLLDRAKSAGLAREVLAKVPTSRGAGPSVVVVVDSHRGRRDVGAPAALAELAARQGRTVAQYTIGLVETDAERTDIEAYDVETLRSHAVWLTPTLHAPACSE